MAFKFNPISGQLDLINKQEVADANKLVLDRDLVADTSALKIVYLNGSNQFVVADPSTYNSSLAVGVTLQAGLALVVVTAHMF